jgi:hypothetical protein
VANSVVRSKGAEYMRVSSVALSLLWFGGTKRSLSLLQKILNLSCHLLNQAPGELSLALLLGAYIEDPDSIR